MSLYEHILYFLSNKYRGVEGLGHVVGACLTSKETATQSSEVIVPFSFPQAVYKSSISFASSPTLGVVRLFNFSYSVGIPWF